MLPPSKAVEYDEFNTIEPPPRPLPALMEIDPELVVLTFTSPPFLCTDGPASIDIQEREPTTILFVDEISKSPDLPPIALPVRRMRAPLD